MTKFLAADMLFSTAGTHIWDQLRASIRQVCRSNQVDAIVLTGDISTTGDEKDLQHARSQLKRLESNLGKDGPPIEFLPGNHERLGNAYAKVPKCEKLEDYAARRADQIRHSTHFENIFGISKRVRVLIRHTREGIRLCVIAADFSLPEVLFHVFDRTQDRSKKCGLGWVTNPLLNELDAVTTEERKAASQATEFFIPVWAVHFPPYCIWDNCIPKPFDGVPKHLQLINSRALLETAKRHGVACILSGHHHWPHQFDQDGVNLCVAGSALEMHATMGNYFHLIEVETSNLPSSRVKVSVQNFKHGLNGENEAPGFYRAHDESSKG